MHNFLKYFLQIGRTISSCYPILLVTSPMNSTNISLAKQIINPSYISLAQNALNAQQIIFTNLLAQRQLPEQPLSQSTILYILNVLSLMDTNNFEGKCGVGERESRIYSNLVKERHYFMGHGIGRSGDVMANQPKAAGSSLLLQLTRYLTISALKIMNYGFVDDVLLVPLATGMSLTLALLTMKEIKPKTKYVLWPRIDQKTCLKCIQAANLIPVVIEGVVQEGDDDSISTNLSEIVSKIEQLGAENITAILTTSSCFAPRVFDSLEQVSEICKKYDIYHLLNNAYGLQCSKIANSIKQSMKIKLDCVVQSTDKNFMVPVGGSLIFTNNPTLLQKITTKYPGRACGAPITDLFITFLEMGKSGLKHLYQTRKENFKYMKEKATEFSKRHNQRVLETKRNSISLALTVGNITKSIRGNETELGSILFSKKVMGHRVIAEKNPSKVFGIEFRNYGSHVENYKDLPYLNMACAIGCERAEIDQFFSKLEEAIKEINKKHGKKEILKIQKIEEKKAEIGEDVLEKTETPISAQKNLVEQHPDDEKTG